MRTRNGILAAAAATLFVTGAVGAPAASAQAAEKVKCEGVNTCKGQSDCKTASSECAGHNACGGKGFKMLTPQECEDAKAEMAKKAAGSEKEEM